MSDYDATRARVDGAYRRMRDLEAIRHRPADARAAARIGLDLRATLDDMCRVAA